MLDLQVFLAHHIPEGDIGIVQCTQPDLPRCKPLTHAGSIKGAEQSKVAVNSVSDIGGGCLEQRDKKYIGRS